MGKNDETISTFIREYDLKNKDLPFTFEIMEGLKVGQKSIEFYYRNYWTDYPKEKRLTRNEQDILKVYDKCETYDDVAIAVKKKYTTAYSIIIKLQERGLIGKKDKKKWEDKPRNLNKKTISDKEIIYIKVIEGDFKGLSGYTSTERYKSKSNTITCTLYNNSKNFSYQVKKKHIKVLTPHKLQGRNK